MSRFQTIVCFLLVSLQVAGQHELIEFRKGVNLSHWVSQNINFANRKEYIQESDFRFIRSQGFDHVRLPFDEEHLWDEEGNQLKEGWTLLNSAMKWAQKNQLKVVLDYHILRSHHFNVEDNTLWTNVGAQQKFVDQWKVLAKHFQSQSAGFLAFEIMNEPVAPEARQWNQLLAKVVAGIRQVDKKRVLIIGSNKWQSPKTFHELEVPKNDPNLMLSFHFYEPMLLTHFRAPWVASIKDYWGGVRYPGEVVEEADLQDQDEEVKVRVRSIWGEFDKDILRSLMKPAVDKAKQLGLRLYCGEWGCINHVHALYRHQWYKDVRALLEHDGIGWAVWDYKGSKFGISPEGKPDEALIKLLTK